MKITAKIIVIAMVLAFAMMQSTAMAEWKLKPPGEILKNVSKKAAVKASNDPNLKKAAEKKLKGEDEDEIVDADKEKEKDKKNDQ